MKSRSLVVALAAFCISILAVVPAQAKIKKAAFGPDKRFAVVMVLVNKTITLRDSNFFRDGREGWLEEDENGRWRHLSPKGFSEKVTKEKMPIIFEMLNSTGKFQLIPEETVLSNETYKSMKQGEFAAKMNALAAEGPTPGYMLDASKKKNRNKLAKVLGVDGTAVITIDHFINYDGSWVDPTDAKNRHHIHTQLGIEIKDKKGKTIWRDSAYGWSENGPHGRAGAPDWEKMPQSVEESLRATMTKLLVKFNKGMK